jgi:hypothetical protein
MMRRSVRYIHTHVLNAPGGHTAASIGVSFPDPGEGSSVMTVDALRSKCSEVDAFPVFSISQGIDLLTPHRF